MERNLASLRVADLWYRLYKQVLHPKQLSAKGMQYTLLKL